MVVEKASVQEGEQTLLRHAAAVVRARGDRGGYAGVSPADAAELSSTLESIAATADGNRILVANWFSDTVQAIDPAGMAVVETLDMPEGPRAFGQFIGRP